MPSGGTVHVSAMSTGDCVVIEVADTGGGLNETALGNLFEAFRGSRNGGTGLGLAIARDLVRAHGGDLELARTGPLGTARTRGEAGTGVSVAVGFGGCVFVKKKTKNHLKAHHQ